MTAREIAIQNAKTERTKQMFLNMTDAQYEQHRKNIAAAAARMAAEVWDK